jgi:hypothetical protein
MPSAGEMSESDKGEKCFLASYLMVAAAFLVIDIGQAYNTIAFRPDYHGGWWEALTVGFFDWDGWKAFAGSTAGKITYGGAALLVIAAVVLFCLAIRFAKQSEKSE